MVVHFRETSFFFRKRLLRYFEKGPENWARRELTWSPKVESQNFVLLPREETQEKGKQQALFAWKGEDGGREAQCRDFSSRKQVAKPKFEHTTTFNFATSVGKELRQIRPEKERKVCEVVANSVPFSLGGKLLPTKKHFFATFLSAPPRTFSKTKKNPRRSLLKGKIQRN